MYTNILCDNLYCTIYGNLSFFFILMVYNIYLIVKGLLGGLRDENNGGGMGWVGREGRNTG